MTLSNYLNVRLNEYIDCEIPNVDFLTIPPFINTLKKFNFNEEELDVIADSYNQLIRRIPKKYRKFFSSLSFPGFLVFLGSFKRN